MKEEIKLCIAGDFFPGGVILNQEKICSTEIKNFMESVDIRVATLECALGEGYPYDVEKMNNPAWRNVVYSPNQGVEKLKTMKIDIVSIANNHIFDLGEEGLLNTMQLLDKNGILYCGAGFDYEEAKSPAVIEIKGKRLAFLSYMVYFDGWRAPHPAGMNKPGINIFKLENALEDIKQAKNKYDYVFILPHWGTEYSVWPTPQDVDYAKMMIKAGADGIFGSHAHIVQPSVKVNKKPVFYNLGNFIFPDFYMNTDRTVYYPIDGESMNNTPISYTYERNPQTKILRKWPMQYRKGIISLIKLDGSKINEQSVLVELDVNNILRIDNTQSHSCDFICAKFGLKNRLYRKIYKYRFLINPIILAKIICSHFTDLSKRIVL